ncbi:hypothetical protein [Massilia sp. Leaf139]|uniref:hypothetical protein n=1 Tax=Massilia sp. Leaf139 TaxID=1736272 RepID=UPI0006F8891C|nr:hypothetical protein [Massilia sp. Leaf139]KQQ96725.1 hypothetical protein ASF77_01625 [Massilia sp. Leaf139]
MASAQPTFQQPRPFAGIGVSLAVHALLIGLWQLSRPLPVQETSEAPRVQFLRLVPTPAAERAVPAAAARAPAIPRASAGPAARQPAAREPVAAPVESATEVIALPAPQAAETPAQSAADLLRSARAAVGDIDRTLRKENPRRGIEAPIETAQMKLERGIAQAAEMAPNKWYQAPKTQEILDPGGYGRRRYRVITASGTYCVTYESNHAPDGIDTMRNGIKPKMTNCDEDEGPATKQKWN